MYSAMLSGLQVYHYGISRFPLGVFELILAVDTNMDFDWMAIEVLRLTELIRFHYHIKTIPDLRWSKLIRRWDICRTTIWADQVGQILLMTALSTELFCTAGLCCWTKCLGVMKQQEIIGDVSIIVCQLIHVWLVMLSCKLCMSVFLWRGCL